MNDKLFKVLIPSKLIEMGFVEDNDGTEDPRGFEWNIKNEKFNLWVDPWCDVYLARINPDTDGIKLKIDDLYELKCVVDWISDEETKCVNCQGTKFDYHGNCLECGKNINDN